MVNLRKQISQARKAMFALLAKVTKLHLPIDISLDLFDKLVLPILLYGCEVWGFESIDQIDVFYRKFVKYILKLNKYTPNCMIYGETGRMPIQNIINSRMISFWNRIKSGKVTKYSYVLLNLTKLFNDDVLNSFSSGWLCKVRDILNHCGFGYIWLNDMTLNKKVLKRLIERHSIDTYKQTWYSEVFNNSCCFNYRILKSDLVFENYLTQLSYNDRVVLCRFRCGNVRLPSNCRRFGRDEFIDTTCNLCNLDVPGDEFHYLFICETFKYERAQHLKKYYTINPNSLKMSQLFNSNSINTLKKLCKLIIIIQKRFA